MARFSWMYCLIASLWLNQDLISDNRPAISAVPARAVVTWKQGWHPRVTPCEGTRAYSRKHTHTDTYVYIKRTLTIWRHKSLQLHTLFFLLLLIFSVSLLPDSSQHSPLYTHTFARLVSLETALIRASSGGGGVSSCIRLSVTPVVSTSVASQGRAHTGPIRFKKPRVAWY